MLRKNGFAVLEGMVPADEQLAMEAAAIRHFEGLPKGYFTSPLRADRSQVHVPYEAPGCRNCSDLFSSFQQISQRSLGVRSGWYLTTWCFGSRRGT